MRLLWRQTGSALTQHISAPGLLAVASLKLAPWSTPRPPCPAPQAPTSLTSNSGQLYWVQTEQRKERTSEKQHQIKNNHSAKSVEANLCIGSRSICSFIFIQDSTHLNVKHVVKNYNWESTNNLTATGEIKYLQLKKAREDNNSQTKNL